MITTKGRTMNRLTELKQEMPSFGLRNRRSNETKARSRRVILLLLLLLFWAAGCEDYHSSSPGYYGPAYYGGDSGDFLDHDRLYYRGPGYWYGGAYYVWEPGYWAFRTGVSAPGSRYGLPNPGQLLWIHGHYIAQGY